MAGREAELAALGYELGLAEDLASLREVVAARLRAVIPADMASYTEVSMSTGEALVLTDPETAPGHVLEPEPADRQARMPRRALRSPGIAERGDIPERVDSPQSSRPATRSPHVVDRVAVTVHQSSDAVVGLALHRSRRPFSSADRRTLDGLGTVVGQARDQVIARAHGQALLADLHARGRQATGVLVLAADGRVAFASDRARSLLDRHFPDFRGAGLPPELDPGLVPGSVSVLTGLGTSLAVTRLPAGVGEATAYELSEREPVAGGALTARERGILARIALGESNAAAARALGISPRTVENHLRAIYRKLGVNSRTAAVARIRA